jgi:oligopeptide/dipeptide ABC transporter ATP-binding protein
LPLLDVHNLVKSFHVPGGSGRVVDDVSLSIDAGETLGLVGESGCGKTTLSRCVLRLEPPTSGAITFDGQDLANLSGEGLRRIRRSMQIVFQDPYASLDPRWTVAQTLAEPLRVHGIVPASERRAEVERLLASVALPPSAAGRYPHEFSGGQRQRIGIARALALRPKLLIADEPVSALDVSVRAQVLNLLRDAQAERGLAMLFIAHDLGAVRLVSKRIAVMYLGQIVEEGPSDALFDDPRHPYTRGLLSAIPSIRMRAKHSEKVVETPSGSVAEGGAPTSGCRFRTRCPFAQAICAEVDPPYAAIAPRRHSRCHFALELPQFELVPRAAASSGPSQ